MCRTTPVSPSASQPGAVLAGERIVDPVCERLASEERMRRPAAAKVDLERVGLPSIVARDDDEIDRGAPDHSLAGQTPADLQALGRDPLGVFLIGREVAAEIRLLVRAAEHLV